MTHPPAPASTDEARSGRWIEFVGAHNVRDLGGYRIADGRIIRHGRLFRADGLANLTDDDLDVIDALGIRTVIDLRSATELAERGRFPLERYPVAFHHLPIVDATWMETGVPVFPDTAAGAVDFLVWAYHDMLATGADRFARAIDLARDGRGDAGHVPLCRRQGPDRDPRRPDPRWAGRRRRRDRRRLRTDDDRHAAHAGVDRGQLAGELRPDERPAGDDVLLRPGRDRSTARRTPSDPRVDRRVPRLDRCERRVLAELADQLTR